VNPQVLALLPVLSPIASLIVIVLGVFFSNRHVDVRIADVNRNIDNLTRHMENRFNDLNRVTAAESARLEAVIKAEIQKLDSRIKALEDRAGLIYRG